MKNRINIKQTITRLNAHWSVKTLELVFVFFGLVESLGIPLDLGLLTTHLKALEIVFKSILFNLA